ncbi:MAG: hypothetical protein ACTSQF_00635 [Candidatus Heimdallarchaeaceae archaeon]
MAEKIKNSRKRNQKEWIYQFEVRKAEPKRIVYFNGHQVLI